MKKKVSISILVTCVILAMTVTFSITVLMAMRLFNSTVASVKEKESMYSKISEIDKYVRANGYYTIDENTLYDTIASGYLLGTGDKYARYYTASAYADLIGVKNGTLVGIGVDVVKDSNTGYARVIRVYDSSPAEDLGIVSGCYLTLIDDVDVKTLSSTDSITAKLRGETGTTVGITWLDTTLVENSATLTRRSYTVPTVSYQKTESGYGYIAVSTFTDSTASELDYAISSLTSAGANSLVFDLRGNTATDMEAAIRCIDLICPEGVAAVAEYSDGTTHELGASEGETVVTLPMVCIVNESTASAAELFAANLRMLSGATLVGANTAGRGTIQSSPQRLSDGSAVVVTVARLLLSDGTSFEGTGLVPDVERVLTADEKTIFYDFTVDNDPQIQRAFAVAANLTGTSSVGATNEAAASSDAAASDEGTDSAATDDAATDDAADAADSAAG